MTNNGGNGKLDPQKTGIVNKLIMMLEVAGNVPIGKKIQLGFGAYAFRDPDGLYAIQVDGQHVARIRYTT